jgi:hypothetical protein
MTQDGS